MTIETDEIIELIDKVRKDELLFDGWLIYLRRVDPCVSFVLDYMEEKYPESDKEEAILFATMFSVLERQLGGRLDKDSRETVRQFDGELDTASRVIGFLRGLTKSEGNEIRGSEEVSVPVVKEVPKTVKAAVDELMIRMSDAEKEKFSKEKEENLIMFHHGLGRWIRNNFGLWSDNVELAKDCGEMHPDDASGVIIEALWKRLSEEQDKEKLRTLWKGK